MHKPAGQSLIEVLLALTIIIVGMVSLVSALINTQNTATASLEETIAVQMGREALEAARFVRDSNWLERENGLGTAKSGTQFNEGLASTTEANDFSGIYLWNPASTNPSTAIQFDYTADTSTDSSTTVYQNLAGLYRQFTTAPGATWQATKYSRYVTLYPICSSDGGLVEQLLSGDGSDCTTTYPGTTQIGVQVRVAVSWSSRGVTKTRVLEERLYDWRYVQS